MASSAAGRQELHQCWQFVAAVWLPWLLITHAGLCPDVTNSSKAGSKCQVLPKVCIDQNIYVLYSNQHNPRHELFTQLPQLKLHNITMDYYGYGDIWGTHFQRPSPFVRPATAGEETRELAHPQFSRCTIPLVIYADDLYMYGHFFANTVATIHMMQQDGTLDDRHNLVIDTFGMQLATFHRFILAPFSHYDITTLSYLSSRLPAEKPESYNPDGQHGRCFWQLLACQFSRHSSNVTKTLSSPLWSTGQAIFQHYRDQLLPIDPQYADPSKFRVLIAVLPRRSKLRAVVNQGQVWSWCTKFRPPQGVKDWNGTACLLHEFGRDLLADLVYSSQADVLLGVHSDSLYSAFYMRKHSSLIEIRPYGFSGRMPNQFLKDMTADDDHSILWWGVNVVNPAHSAPGAFELMRQGAPHTWPRERHTFIRLMALQYLLERIALTRNSRERYLTFRAKHEHHISDTLQSLNDTQHRRLQQFDQQWVEVYHEQQQQKIWRRLKQHHEQRQWPEHQHQQQQQQTSQQQHGWHWHWPEYQQQQQQQGWQQQRGQQRWH